MTGKMHPALGSEFVGAEGVSSDSVGDSATVGAVDALRGRVAVRAGAPNPAASVAIAPCSLIGVGEDVAGSAVGDLVAAGLVAAGLVATGFVAVSGTRVSVGVAGGA